VDTSLRRVHADMHHLSGGLLDIIMSVQRLEDKLDRLAGGVKLVVTRGSRGRRSPSRSHPSPRRRTAAPRSVSVGSDPEWVRDAGSERPARAQTQVSAASNPADAPDRRVRGAVDRNEATAARFAVSGQSKQVADGPLDSVVVRNSRVRAPRGGQGPGELGAPLQAAGRMAADCDLEMDVSAPLDPSESMGGLAELSTKVGLMDRKMDRIAGAVGVRSGGNEGDDDEDRKRLKEKLKAAIETERRRRIHTIVSSSDAWLEYLFGICKPDQRTGKRGSRCLEPGTTHVVV
jgi:hypothetical protein